MAIARIIHYWPDDAGSTILEIELDPSFPDAVDEARVQVTRMWRETCADVADEAGE